MNVDSSEDAPAGPAARGRLRSARRGTVVAVLSATILLIAILTVLTLSTAQDRTASGTTVAGVPAGGLDREALRALLTRNAALTPRTLNVRLGDKQVALLTASAGISIDVEATIAEALRRSPAGNRFLIFGERPGRAISPTLVERDGLLEATARRLAPTGRAPHTDGALNVVGAAVSPVAPTPGKVVTEESIREALRANARRLPRPDVVQVDPAPDPAHVTARQVDELVERVRPLLTAPLRYQAGQITTGLDPAVLASQLRLVADGRQADHGIALSLRPSASKVLAEPVAARLSRSATDSRVTGPSPTPALSEKGSTSWRPRPARLTATGTGKPGQKVTPAQVLAATNAAITADPVPGAPINVASTVLPAADAAALGRVDAVLGTFTTFYAPGQPRVTNIRLIAKTLDGMIVGPGRTFSLNDAAGRRTREKGYVDAPFILDGELSSDVGGGVSQFATTLYNAAFFAGLRLDAHQAHSFYISRYPAGREATVNFPNIDLRFTNDTAQPVVLRTVTTGTSLTVALYGTDDGRSVTATSGPRRSLPGKDFSISVTRALTLPGRPAVRERFTTSYNQSPE